MKSLKEFLVTALAGIVSGSLGLLAQPLDRRHHIGPLVIKSVAEGRRPPGSWPSGRAPWETHAERFHAGVSGLLIDSLHQCVVFQATAVDEIVRRRDLIGIRGSAQDLRHQLIGNLKTTQQQTITTQTQSELFGKPLTERTTALLYSC